MKPVKDASARELGQANQLNGPLDAQIATNKRQSGIFRGKGLKTTKRTKHTTLQARSSFRHGKFKPERRRLDT
jgi:hypothetical protein